MGYIDGTPGWVVEGSKTHHAFTKCTKLDEEKETSGKSVAYSNFDSQKHSACTECSEKGDRLIDRERSAE